MAHSKSSHRSPSSESGSERTKATEGAAELALARELGRLIGKHFSQRFSECDEYGPQNDRHPKVIKSGHRSPRRCVPPDPGAIGA